jgi:hypothetical protein
MDLNELTPEEIVELGYLLNDEMDKEASEQEDDFDLNALSVEEIVELGYLLNDEMSKEASEEEGYDFDLNELDVEDFIELAAELEYDMEKEAMSYSKMKGSIMGAGNKVKSHYSKRYGKAMDAANSAAGTRSGKRSLRSFGRKTSIQNAPSRMQRGKAMGRQFSPEISAAGATVSLGALMANRRGA